jgi:c-di-GMP-related signal transduction protein
VTAKPALSPEKPDQPSGPPEGLRFVARQPILTADQQVFGYELLFRDGVETHFRNPDPDGASRSTLDSTILFGLDTLCDSRRAFVNCTRDVLLKEYITLLPPQLTVVEVLESVEPDDLVIAACKRLVDSGFMIALDDFMPNDPRVRLIQFADLVKVDLTITSSDEREALVKRFRSERCRMVAEKVETHEQFETAKSMGFTYFQGFFFRRPEILAVREIPANRVNYLRMLKLVSEPELDMKDIEKLVKSEAGVCYRFLRYLNSPIFGFSNEIRSVRQGLSLLGEREVRRWIRMVATMAAGEGKPTELIFSTLVRARFCELLASKVPHGNSDLFLMGLLSLMDAIMELPMSRVLEQIPLDHETKDVLLGKPSSLRPIYQLMLAQESGEWEQATHIAAKFHLADSVVADLYFEAMQWGRQTRLGA